MRTPKQSSGADAQVQMPILPQSDPAHRARRCSLLLGHKRERAQHRAAIASAMFTEAKPIYQPSRRRQRRPLQPTSAVARCRACQREAAAGGHDKRNEISGHANGEEQPTGGIGRRERLREPAVHGDADQGERKRGRRSIPALQIERKGHVIYRPTSGECRPSEVTELLTACEVIRG